MIEHEKFDKNCKNRMENFEPLLWYSQLRGQMGLKAAEVALVWVLLEILKLEILRSLSQFISRFISRVKGIFYISWVSSREYDIFKARVFLNMGFFIPRIDVFYPLDWRSLYRELGIFIPGLRGYLKILVFWLQWGLNFRTRKS